jgi:predicted alpha/beta-fold hydrolase
MNYTAPWWLPGGNLQTIWPALYAQRVLGPHPTYRRERWDTPDGDFIDVDWLADPAPAEAPIANFYAPVQVFGVLVWCCSMAWKARHAATMPRLLRASPVRAAGRMRCRIFGGAAGS